MRTLTYSYILSVRMLKHGSLPAWLRQAESDCPDGKKPVVIMHKANSSQDYITLRLEDFFDCVNSDKVIRKR